MKRRAAGNGRPFFTPASDAGFVLKGKARSVGVQSQGCRFDSCQARHFLPKPVLKNEYSLENNRGFSKSAEMAQSGTFQRRVCQHSVNTFEIGHKIRWSQAPAVNTLTTLRTHKKDFQPRPASPQRPDLPATLVPTRPERSPPRKSNPTVSAADGPLSSMRAVCTRRRTRIVFPARRARIGPGNQCERHSHGSPSNRAPEEASRQGIRCNRSLGHPVPESLQLHTWPKILCKAPVKVGFPPGEALTRSLILEDE